MEPLEFELILSLVFGLVITGFLLMRPQLIPLSIFDEGHGRDSSRLHRTGSARCGRPLESYRLAMHEKENRLWKIQ